MLSLISFSLSSLRLLNEPVNLTIHLIYLFLLFSHSWSMLTLRMLWWNMFKWPRRCSLCLSSRTDRKSLSRWLNFYGSNEPTCHLCRFKTIFVHCTRVRIMDNAYLKVAAAVAFVWIRTMVTIAVKVKVTGFASSASPSSFPRSSLSAEPMWQCLLRFWTMSRGHLRMPFGLHGNTMRYST